MIKVSNSEVIKEQKELPEVIELVEKAREFQAQGNKSKAISFYNKAIKHGSVVAPNLLAELYFNESNRPNRKKILKLMLLGASRGDLVAQKNVGIRLQDIEYVKKIDYTKAFKYLYSSASQGNAEAAIAIAYLYVSYKIEKDEIESAYWANKALDDIYDEAINLIKHLTLTSEQLADQADLFFYGNETTKVDYNRAFALYHVASLKDNPSVYSQAMLGFCYYTGKGTKVDIDSAKYYLVTAYKAGNTSVKKYIDEINNYLKPYRWDEYIQMIKVEPSSEEATKIYNTGASLFTQKKYSEAVQPLLKAAKLNSADAYTKLGAMYQNGFGVKTNESRAYKMYRQAADLGDAIAQYEVARLLEVGKGCEVSQKSAFYYMYCSASQGNPLATRELCRYFRDGIGCVSDHLEAFYWLSKTLNAKDKICQDLYASLTNIDGEEATRRGNLFYMGKEEKQDFSRAFYYYFAGAEKVEQINPACLFNLGLCYYYGRGTDVNLPVALQYAKLSREKGYKFAGQLIEKCTLQIQEMEQKEKEKIDELNN